MSLLDAVFEALPRPQRALEAVQDQLVLGLNHLLAQEPMAAEQLRSHAGSSVLIQALQTELHLRITPVGWFELSEPGVSPDLCLILDLTSPQELIPLLWSQQLPAVRIEGDAALAARVQWLLDHLRWDWADDLERWLGPAAAATLEQGIRACQAGLQRFLAGARAMQS
jgi:ubiquinone biosynthesis protein UbiJ